MPLRFYPLMLFRGITPGRKPYNIRTRAISFAESFASVVARGDWSPLDRHLTADLHHLIAGQGVVIGNMHTIAHHKRKNQTLPGR